MLAEAYYDNGKIEFTRSYRFRHNRFKISVEVPDEEIDSDTLSSVSPEILTQARVMLSKLDVIRNAPLSADNDEELTEKQRERFAAFELRAQLRREQGRPV